MLYEGAIKFGNIAIMAMQNNDPSKAHENVVKVEKIIQNFRDTLDKKYPIWEDFEKVYAYLLRRCHEANIAKDPEIMEEVVGHLRSMRDNWKEVMKKVASDRAELPEVSIIRSAMRQLWQEEQEPDRKTRV